MAFSLNIKEKLIIISIDNSVCYIILTEWHNSCTTN